MAALGVPDFELLHDTPPLADDDIHLWHVRAADASPAQLRALARTQLLRRLADYAPACALDLQFGEHGKPCAPDADGIEFNLSHCAGSIVLAFARAQPLGVDIERGDRRAVSLDIARRFFQAQEAAKLSSLPVTLQQRAFLNLWTHKEAVLKALGVGLSFGLSRLAFSLGKDGEVLGLHEIAAEAGTADAWHLQAFSPADALFGCLAWRGPPRRVRAFTAPA